MDPHGLKADRPAPDAGFRAAAKTSPAGVLGRARIWFRYERSLRPWLARFSRAGNPPPPPGGLLFVCAMGVEERIARRLGPTVRVGLGATNGVPSDGSLVSFGIAGALAPDLEIGTVIDATRVVDESGSVLWEGGPIGVASARTGTILGASRIVDEPVERMRLHNETGADAVDMESGPLARSGRLAGCIRAISDTPERQLGGLAEGVKPNGDPNYPGLARAFLRAPRETLRAALDARRALKSLEAVA